MGDAVSYWIDAGRVHSDSQLRSMLTAWGAFCKGEPLFVTFPDGRRLRVA